jgi:DNA (cytosine-5)-methyltransferase 1
MNILDVFSCAGGAARGYARAAHKPYGIEKDEKRASRYPYPVYVGDAVEALRILLAGGKLPFQSRNGPFEIVTEWMGLSDFGLVHGSPPCQRYSTMTGANRADHPDLVPITQELFRATGLPYVIENVPAAPLRADLKLCGSMFGLRVRRHRIFEANFPITQPVCDHKAQGRAVGVYGQSWESREYLRPDGSRRGNKATSLADGLDAMGVTDMTWRDLVESIPPAYSEYIVGQL